MWSNLIYRLRAILRPSAMERDLDDELQFHIDRHVQRYIASGLSPREAARRARLEWGGLAQVKEECRQARGIGAFEILRQDLRYGARALVRNPGFTAVVLLTLAIAIGANTAIFSIVNAVLLRPLPYPAAGRLTMIWGAGRNSARQPFSDADFLDYAAQNRTFEQMASLQASGVTLTGASQPERVAAGVVSPSFFDVLQVPAALGRTFRAEEGRPGNDTVVVLTHGVWVRRYGADPNIVGRRISMNLQPYTVIGVLPPWFDFSLPGSYKPKEIYLPAVLKHDDQLRASNHLRVIARLRPGVSASQAQTDLDGISRHLAQSYPATDAGLAVRIVALQDQIAGNVRTLLWILMAAVSLVLLIACANVANLQLARASARRKEIAIRAALGAGRGRVARQLLTESLLLAILGGLLGIALGWAGVRALLVMGPSDLTAGQDPRLDWTVLAYSAGISLFAGILFGIAPALQSAVGRVAEVLKQTGRSIGDGRGAGRLRTLLMAGEVGLSLVLLAGAGLLIRSFVELARVNPGFEPHGVLTMPMVLPRYAYATEEQQAAFYRRALARMSSLPGVQSAGAIDDLPLTNDRDSNNLSVEGRPPVPLDQVPEVQQRSVTPAYFRAMGVPLVAGRVFSEADAAGAPPVLVINRETARRIFPGENPIGRRVVFGLPGNRAKWMTIVGVVGDVRDLTLDAQPEMEVYRPYAQAVIPYMTLVLRTGGEPSALAGAARAAFHELDRDLPLYQARPMDAVLAVSIDQRRFDMLLLSVFAAVALALAAVGIYGVVSYSVAQRTSEIGLRMALGAARGHVLRLVIGRSLAIAAAGGAAGILVSLAATRLLSNMLYGVSASDPWTFAAVTAVLSVTTAMASYLPARRAMKVDPMTALRND